MKAKDKKMLMKYYEAKIKEFEYEISRYESWLYNAKSKLEDLKNNKKEE
jgi:hypothetical protein